MDRKVISREIQRILEKINREDGLGLEISEHTIIIGEFSRFDSLAFLDLISGLEEWIAHSLGVFISVVSEEENFDPDGPFGTAGRLADYLSERLENETQVNPL